MNIRRLCVPFGLAALLLAACVRADSPPPTPAPSPAAAPADAESVRWLDKLEARGNDLKTLQAKVQYTVFNAVSEDTQTRLGPLLYTAADPDKKSAAKFAVNFDSLVIDNKVIKQDRTYIFDGEWFVEKEVGNNQKRFTKRQVVAPGQTVNPLQIDGPFPVPLGQKRDQVLARFSVKLIPVPESEAKTFDKPPIHLQLTPRADAPLDRNPPRFRTIDIWYDTDLLLPVKVVAVSPNKSVTTFRLSDLKVNDEAAAKLTDRFDTAVPPPNSGWQVTVTPWEQ
jgi:hypothetical protein